MDTPTESRKADVPDSWTSQMKTDSSSFLGETSLHGIKHVGDKTRSKFRRCIWLLLVLGMSVWLSYTLYSLYTRYKSYPYTTHSTVIPKTNLPLPGISICLRHSIQRSRLRQLTYGDVIQDFLEMSDSREEMLNNETVRAALSSVTMQELMNVGSFRAEEVIYYAYVSLGGLTTSVFDLSKDFYAVDAFTGISGLPTRCFTFNATSRSEKDGVLFFSQLETWEVILQSPMTDLIPGKDDIGGLFVSIHLPWEPPSTFQAINVQPSSTVDIMLTPSEYHFLPAPYLSMDNEDCEDTNSPDYVSHVRYLPRYSYGNCVIEKSTLAGVEACNCTSQSLEPRPGLRCTRKLSPKREPAAVFDWLTLRFVVISTNRTPQFVLPHLGGTFLRFVHLSPGNLEVPFCTLLQHYQCFANTAGLKILSLLTECKSTCVIERIDTKSASVTPFPSQHYIRSLPQEELNGTNLENWLRVNVKFANTFLAIIKHKPELTFDSIYSIVGGQMGLFLGASLLTVTELAEHLLCLIWASLKGLLGNRNRMPRSSVDSTRLSK